MIHFTFLATFYGWIKICIVIQLYIVLYILYIYFWLCRNYMYIYRFLSRIVSAQLLHLYDCMKRKNMLEPSQGLNQGHMFTCYGNKHSSNISWATNAIQTSMKPTQRCNWRCVPTHVSVKTGEFMLTEHFTSFIFFVLHIYHFYTQKRIVWAYTIKI